ncbi:hypothetical protein QT971_26705 [Microcoleus sp. herbarium19]
MLINSLPIAVEDKKQGKCLRSIARAAGLLHPLRQPERTSKIVQERIKR